MAQPSPAVKKALAKLEASLESDQSYEGHELFKTVYHRQRARKHLEDSYALAEGGALLQLRKGQLNCGAELGTMLVDAYTTDAVPGSEEAVGRVLNIMDAFPNEARLEDEDPPIERCTKVASAAVKWLKKVDGLEYAPRIYGQLALYIMRCLGWTGLGVATPNFVRSDNLKEFAEAVVASVAQGNPGEEDLFIARAVLHTVSTKPLHASVTSITRAREVLAHYATAAGHALPDTPLMHFITLFIEALEKRSVPLVDILLQEYAESLYRDESLWDLVGKARDIYAPAPVAAMPGIFGDLFRSMLMPA